MSFMVVRSVATDIKTRFIGSFVLCFYGFFNCPSAWVLKYILFENLFLFVINLTCGCAEYQ